MASGLNCRPHGALPRRSARTEAIAQKYPPRAAMESLQTGDREQTHAEGTPLE
jgi:hypothetical protein